MNRYAVILKDGVLIPLVQGRFLFPDFLAVTGAVAVLIPLVQGRFLFQTRHSFPSLCKSLNPFGSGTFFIPARILALEKFEYSLNPFGSGTFFIPVAIAFPPFFNRLERYFPSFCNAGKLLSCCHTDAFRAICCERERLWAGKGFVRLISAWVFCFIRMGIQDVMRPVYPFMQGLSVVRDRFLGILWLFFDECHRAEF